MTTETTVNLERGQTIQILEPGQYAYVLHEKEPVILCAPGDGSISTFVDSRQEGTIEPRWSPVQRALMVTRLRLLAAELAGEPYDDGDQPWEQA